MLSLYDLIAKTRSVGDEYLKLLLALLLLLIKHLLIRIKTGLTLGLASFGSHTHPLKLALKSFATLGCRLLFLFHALGLLVEP